MNALRHRSNDVLVVAGSVGLVLLVLPLLAVIAFMLRAAFLVAFPVALVAGSAMWLLSPRFRGWFRTATSVMETYKGLRVAPDVALTGDHAWVRPAGTNVTVGADDLLAAALGPLDAVELPPRGRRVRRGEVLFRLRRGDRALDVRAPVAGTVVAGNKALAREPALVNADPFRRGWVVKVRRAAESSLDEAELRRGRDALAWFEDEVDRFLATVTSRRATVPVAADGGLVMGNLHQQIDDQTWPEVKRMLEGSRS